MPTDEKSCLNGVSVRQFIAVPPCYEMFKENNNFTWCRSDILEATGSTWNHAEHLLRTTRIWGSWVRILPGAPQFASITCEHCMAIGSGACLSVDFADRAARYGGPEAAAGSSKQIFYEHAGLLEEVNRPGKLFDKGSAALPTPGSRSKAMVRSRCRPRHRSHSRKRTLSIDVIRG